MPFIRRNGCAETRLGGLRGRRASGRTAWFGRWDHGRAARRELDQATQDIGPSGEEGASATVSDKARHLTVVGSDVGMSVGEGVGPAVGVPVGVPVGACIALGESLEFRV